MKTFLKKLWPKKRAESEASQNAPVIHAGSSASVLYQTWGLSGSALWYIDQGYQNALREGNHRWATWDPNSEPLTLIKTIEKLEPQYVLLNLQTIQRRACSWSAPAVLQKLIELKNSIGFKVACRSHPSNLNDLFQQYAIDFSQFNENVRSFYQQPQHPDSDEQIVFDSGLINVIRTAFYHGTYEIGFRNYLDLGCSILEEPHAADLSTYTLDSLVAPKTKESEFDILFVGGCWPFKWQNMQPYVTALKKRFGARFRIYGQNWPDGLSCGHLQEEAFNSTICEAKINLTLHELSQTLADPISGNERVFKLGAMNCFSMTDANPLIQYHFEVDQEVAFCRNADEMVERSEFYLANPELRSQRAQTTHQTVINEHSYTRRLEQIWTACASQNPIVKYDSVADSQPTELSTKAA